jgi:hypothetical protein
MTCIAPNRDRFATYGYAVAHTRIGRSATIDAAIYRRQHLGRRFRNVGNLASPENDHRSMSRMIAAYAAAVAS